MTSLAFTQHATLALTAQSDSQSLARTFIGILDATGWVGSVTLLEAHGTLDSLSGTCDTTTGAFVRRFDPELGIAHRRPPDMRGVIAALVGEAPVEIRAAACQPGRLVIPIKGQGNPQRLLALDSPTMDPVERVSLLHLAEIFGHQLNMIDLRERDQLTGLLNRQAFVQRYLQIMSLRAPERGIGVRLAVFDIDHFKRVNDTFGHLFGDDVLLLFARVMESSFRYTDALFRFGGEEFVALIRADEDGAEIGLERFRAAVESYPFPRIERLTVSTGYVRASPEVHAPQLIDAADQALYAAKHGGRNRIVRGACVAEHREGGAVEMS